MHRMHADTCPLIRACRTRVFGLKRAAVVGKQPGEIQENAGEMGCADGVRWRDLRSPFDLVFTGAREGPKSSQRRTTNLAGRAGQYLSEVGALPKAGLSCLRWRLDHLSLFQTGDV